MDGSEGRAVSRTDLGVGSELHVPLTDHVIVTPSGRYAAVYE